MRYTMDVATGEVGTTRLAPGHDMEFPVIPSHLMTRPVKYCYAAANLVAESVSEGRDSVMCVYRIQYMLQILIQDLLAHVLQIIPVQSLMHWATYVWLKNTVS